MQRNYGNEKPPPFSYPDPKWIQETGCVLFLPFNELGGNKAYDLSGKGNNGTLTNMANPPTATSGWAGRGLSFDEVNDYVNAADNDNLSFSPTQVNTVCLWLKGGSQVDTTRILAKSSSSVYNYDLNVTSNTIIQAHTYDGVNNKKVSFGTVLNNNWHFLCAVFDRTGLLKTYLDGNFVASTDISTMTDTRNTANLTIGSFPAPSGYFNGIIDDVRIYNKALSADEIRHQYAEPYYMIPRPLSNTPRFPNWTINKDIILSSLSLEHDAKSYMLSALTLEGIYKDYLKSSFNLEEVATAYINGELNYEQAITSFIQASFSLEVIAKDYMKSSLNISPDQLMRMVIQTIKRKDGISTISRKRNITIEGK